MSHPTWLLLPWAVFALAAMLKAWQITAVMRRNLARSKDRATAESRALLERIWRNDSLSAR